MHIFIEKIKNGHGNVIEEDHLERFVNMLPTKQEIEYFEDKLAEHDLKSFAELNNLKAPKTLHKLEKAEMFIILIIENIEVIEKAQVMRKLLKIDRIIDQA